MIHVDITVSGVVQGVGFRYFTIDRAGKFGIKGYVKNLPNGNVYCEAEGTDGLIRDFIKLLNIGPSMSRVTNVNVYETKELKNYKDFKVRY